MKKTYQSSMVGLNLGNQIVSITITGDFMILFMSLFAISIVFFKAEKSFKTSVTKLQKIGKKKAGTRCKFIPSFTTCRKNFQQKYL